ncbi:MAG TPA: GNAT family N-acetyltransferase [Solirubrobacterales bacterium]|nr:GNAT family N-acetyltransferase [Solirubrobacterales bacterium]
MSARAELIEDGGRAAAGTEFFRTPQFLAAEGVTHTLRIEAEDIELVAPLIVRPIGDGPDRDATSPYGYPGLVLPAPDLDDLLPRNGSGPAKPLPSEDAVPALDPAAIDFSATGLVSIFLRHRLSGPTLGAATPRNVVQIADPELPRKSRPSDRRQVRRNFDAGYALRIIRGTFTEPEDRAAFLDVYEQTMRRTGAADHYFFGAEYFDRILETKCSWLALTETPGGEVAAASIATESDGFLHYYLSGSADAHLGDSPMKNIVSSLVEHAEELGLPLNLGGGIRPGDALEEFKRGFANRTLQWRTSEIVCDPGRYRELSSGREAGDYFPAYRAA